MKKKVEKYCIMNDEKIDLDIFELNEQIELLSSRLASVSNPQKYQQLVRLRTEANAMIAELEAKKLMNKAFYKKHPTIL